MSDFVIAAFAWVGLALHLIVGILALRSAESRQLVPALNLVTAACVIVYWVHRWVGYLSRGVTWYASDQVIPLYAILVCVLAGGTLASRYSAPTLNWLVFTMHAVALVGAVLFVTFFRMKLF